MGLTLVGVSHRTAPVDLRERLSVGTSGMGTFAAEARDLTASAEAVVLSTCNRTELYFADGTDHSAEVATLLSRRAGEDISSHLYSRYDRDAVSHLFAVAAGLDSMVFGEAQIQGQVRHSLAQCADVAGVVLARLFHAAGTCASRVRSETVVARGAGSVGSAAVELARRILGPLAGRRAMVLGAGEIAGIALECLRDDGVDVSVVANRTHARALELAERYGARAMHYDECWPELASVDLLICSTAAPRAVVHAEHVAPAVRGRDCRPLCILDIALPRDVSPEVTELENVHLYDLDDLQTAANGVLERRREGLDAAEAIIGAESSRYWQWLAGLRAAPVLTQMREEMERLRVTELAGVENRFGPLTAAERDTLEQFSRTLMNKFLHLPSVRLREAAGNGRGPGVVDVARYLFGVEEARASDHEPGDTA